MTFSFRFPHRCIRAPRYRPRSENANDAASIQSAPVDAGDLLSGIKRGIQLVNGQPRGREATPGKDPAMATDPLVSTFGGSQADENAVRNQNNMVEVAD